MQKRTEAERDRAVADGEHYRRTRSDAPEAEAALDGAFVALDEYATSAATSGATDGALRISAEAKIRAYGDACRAQERKRAGQWKTEALKQTGLAKAARKGADELLDRLFRAMKHDPFRGNGEICADCLATKQKGHKPSCLFAILAGKE